MRGMFSVFVALACVALLPGQAVSAASPFTIYGGLGYGKIMEDNAPDGSVGFSGGVIYQPQNLPVAFGGEIGYLMLGKNEISYYEKGVEASAALKWSTIPITGQLYYMVPTSGSVVPFVDVGGGFYNLRAKAEASADTEYGDFSVSGSDSETKFGINFGGGLQFGNPESRFSFGADARYHVIMTDVENTNLLTLFGRVYYR